MNTAVAIFDIPSPCAPVKTGEVLDMKVIDVEGLATHNSPESCGVVREDKAEALTGEGAGPVLSRERHESLPGADLVRRKGRPYCSVRKRECRRDPARSETRCMHRSTSCGNREVPCLTAAMDGAAVRIENPKGARR
jgi:hypothetical protein